MLTPVPFTLKADSDAEKRLKRYLSDRVTALRLGLEQLHGYNGVVKWRKAYEAIPAEETREFPWHGASNLVVPIIGIHTDTLLARVMAAVMKTKPMWIAKTLGDFADTAPDGIKSAIEEFLEYFALEPSELDLYRVEREWFSDTIKLGTGVIKVPWIKDWLDVVTEAGDGSGKPQFDRKLQYEGPKPTKLRYEKFKYPVNKSTIEEMDFKYHIVTLERHELEDRKLKGVYNSTATDMVLQHPDRTGPDVVDTQKNQDAKVDTVQGYGYAEWDICECHFKYRVDISHYCKVIVWYHEASDQILRSFHNYYPDEIFLASRLFYRDDMFPGMGFAEILLSMQEELSQIHNQRRDNMTVANLKLYRVDPDSPLNKGFKIYPGAMVPAKKDDFETQEFGTPVMGEIDSERLTIEMTEKRSGVSPPMQGMGAGANTKRGVYTAMGTLSLMQEGNTRTDLNITDIRYAHTHLGRILCQEYGMFGLGDRQRMFGKKGELVKQALDAMIDGRMALPVYSSSASVNKEVEKQNDLMLMGVSDRYHQTISAMLAAANNPMTPDAVKQYTIKAVRSANILMQYVYRHFDFDEVDRLAPDPLPSGGSGAPQTPQQPPQMMPQMMPQGTQMPQMPQLPGSVLPGSPDGSGRIQ